MDHDAAQTMVDPKIFEALKSRIEEDMAVRENITQIVQQLEREVAVAQGLLTRIHSTPTSRREIILDASPPHLRPLVWLL